MSTLAALIAGVTATACGDDAGRRAAPPRAEDTAAAPAVPAPPGPAIDFARVEVIGASMSAGFGGAPLDALLDQAIAGPHRVDSAADVFTSRDPVAVVRGQVDHALAAKPTVVFALDALFWYVYVAGVDADRRLAELEVGLAELARIDVPLIVGDIPWMRDASPLMIPPAAIPPPDQLARCNQRIREWAAGRRDVLVVPFSAWVEPLLRGEAVVERDGEPPVAADELMAIDHLHPNRRGVVYILRRVDRAIEERFPATPREALEIAIPR